MQVRWGGDASNARVRQRGGARNSTSRRRWQCGGGACGGECPRPRRDTCRDTHRVPKATPRYMPRYMPRYTPSAQGHEVATPAAPLLARAPLSSPACRW